MQPEKHASLTYPNGLSPLDLLYFNQFAASSYDNGEWVSDGRNVIIAFIGLELKK
jgi:hypothetical protein